MAIFSFLSYSHTHLTAFCPGLPGWASTRKLKPIWILLKQEIVSGSGISWAICKSAPRSRQIDNHTSTHHSVFAGQMPFLPPSQGRQSTEGTFLTSYSKNKNCHHFLKHSVCTKKQVHLCKQKQKMFEKYFLPHSSTVNPAIPPSLTVISVILRWLVIVCRTEGVAWWIVVNASSQRHTENSHKTRRAGTETEQSRRSYQDIFSKESFRENGCLTKHSASCVKQHMMYWLSLLSAM